jgi:hypothetical protein
MPPGKEGNWIQTVPGKGWFVILRLYGALEPWFDGTATYSPRSPARMAGAEKSAGESVG